MDWTTLIYQLLGGLAIFFYGMSLLSGGLQSISSGLIRKVINSLTTNRFIAVLVGLTATCIVQSSSITTVMVVGFVNAGLMQLSQAIGVILGANIGTTITGWIISIKVGKYAYVFLALGILPIVATKNANISAWGRVLFALGMVFMGLQIMGDAFKPLRTNEDFLNIMTLFAADSYFSVVATVGVGCLLTFAVQSSSAMLGITIALAGTGSISFQTAVALVMGENIGTTVTAILAGIGSNLNGRRAAAAHALFNTVGVIFLIIIFPIYVKFIDWVVAYPADMLDAEGGKPYIAVHIAAGHTIFNVVNVILFLPFMNRFSELVMWIFPEKGKQAKHLEYLGTVLTLSPALAIVQAEGAVQKMADMIKVMLGWSKTYVCSAPTSKLRKSILKYESITDKIHQEIMIFVAHVIQGSLNPEEAKKVNSILTVSDELESLGDYCQKVINQLRHTEEVGRSLDKESVAGIAKLMDIVESYFDIVLSNLKSESDIDREKLEAIRSRFNEEASNLRDQQLEAVKRNASDPLATLTVHDIINCLGRVISHSRKVAEAHAGKSLVYSE